MNIKIIDTGTAENSLFLYLELNLDHAQDVITYSFGQVLPTQ